MDQAKAEALRAPFDAALIGKLPKPTKKDNPRGKCRECGGHHGLPAVHLDFVGHAAVTERLLQVDSDWSWVPMARDSCGMPMLDAKGGLWILLTVCGVTRPGYGDETNGKGMKEIIGDALRNGAMRFGVALDHWSKQELAGISNPGMLEGADEEDLVIIATVSDDQLGVLRDMMNMTETEEDKFCTFLKVDKLEDLHAANFDHALGALNTKAKQRAEA